MKLTRAWAEGFAAAKDYQPVQVDGIPEGFSFKQPDLQIGDTLHVGQYVAFLPLRNIEEKYSVTARTVEELLTAYNSFK